MIEGRSQVSCWINIWVAHSSEPLELQPRLGPEEAVNFG